MTTVGPPLWAISMLPVRLFALIVVVCLFLNGAGAKLPNTAGNEKHYLDVFQILDTGVLQNLTSLCAFS